MGNRKAHLSSWGLVGLALIGSCAAANAGSVPTTTTLTPAPLTAFTSAPNNIVVLTANVTGSGATGTVTFKDGANALLCAGGNPATLISGSATCSTLFTIEGIHALSASYSGDSTFSGSGAMANVFIQNHATNSTTTYCNSGPISANGSSNLLYSNTSPYPSVIFVGDGVNTDITTEVLNVSVQLKNFSSANDSDLHMLLVSPDGTHTLDFWSNAGSSATSGIYTLLDSAASPLPETGPLTPGSYRPSAYDITAPDTFAPGPPFPAPQIPAIFSFAPPFGTAGFQIGFEEATAHGAWSIFLWDGSGSPATASGGWCLNITPGTRTSTLTSVSGSPNPASSNTPSPTGSVTLTATVSPVGSSLSVNAGTVTFTDGSIVLGSSPVSNSTAMLTKSLGEGTHQIVASYSGTPTGLAPSSGKFDQRVNTATTNPTAGSGAGPYPYCNTGAITVPRLGFNSGPAGPYPSNIFVTNLPGTVKGVTVTLDGFSTNDQGDLLSLLVGPGGNNLDFFSLTGSSVSVAPSPFNITFSDSAPVPITGNLDSTGTFQSTSENLNIQYPQCPLNASDCANPPVGPPLPSNPFTPTNKAATAGTNILGNANAAGVFGGTTASTYNGNGIWSLYLDDGGPTGAGKLTNVTGGWCLNFTENLPSVSPTLSHSENAIQGEQGVPFTINITNNGTGATGDPTGGDNPLTITDTLNSVFTFTNFSGIGWTCSSAAQTVTCLNHSTVAQGNSYAPLTISVNVSPTASAGATVSNVVQVSGGGVTSTTSNTDIVTILPAPVLAILKSHSGIFTRGQTAQWSLDVSNTVSGSSTNGILTVSDTLPAGFTLASFASTGSAWSCSGVTAVACTTTGAISGGATSAITLTVNVPTNSPASVSNTAGVFGGGDLVHTNASTAAVSTDTVTVVQAPASTITNVTSTVANGSYTIGATVPIQISFTRAVSVTGGPLLALNSGGTAAYASGSGTATLTFTYTVAAGQNSSALDATSTSALTLNGGTILDSGSTPANLTLPAPGAAGSLSANKSIVIDTTSPAVVAFDVLFGAEKFNLVGSTRNRLPWQITGITVLFSKPIATANTNSLGGVTPTSLSGIGTNTLTWTISPIALGNFATTLAGSGANAIKDAAGNPLAGGSGFSQPLKVLWGDFNDDGVVNASDLALENNARSSPYNIFADMNGDGVVDATDVNIVRTRLGTSQP